MQRLFNWAHVDMELIDCNPFKSIKRPRLGGRKRVLSKLEAVKLLRNADDVFRPVLISLRESITRPQEVRALAWELIQWEGEHKGPLSAIAAGDAYFELHDYKSRKQRLDPDSPRVIHINRRFGRLLLRTARNCSTLQGPIFLNQHGLPWTANAVRLRVRRLCKRAGVVADHRGERVVAYTFRHTSATNACANGRPDRILAEIMGHTSTRTTARYQHLSHDHIRDAVERNEANKRRDKPR